MINTKFTISVKNNSSQIISSSDDKFPELKNGSLIQINNENYLYSILNKEMLNYYNYFEAKNSKTLIIKEETKLQKGDTIKLSYDELEAKIITNIKNKGINYKNGNIISALGGKTIMDITSGNTSPTIMKAKLVSTKGEVEQLEIIKNGKYIEPPQNPTKTYNGDGNGLEVEIKYMKSSIKPFIYRNVEDIYNINEETYILLNYGLPPNIKSGEINVQKIIINLYETYKGENKNNCEYKIYSNFTPHLHLPFMLKNTLSPDIVFNKCLLELDKKVKELEDKINNKN